jgi:hypothetical protein
MVILRCCGPAEFFLERVVFPFELLNFQCPPQSEVKIWTHGLGGAELLESIQADELQQAFPAADLSPLTETRTPWLVAG